MLTAGNASSSSGSKVQVCAEVQSMAGAAPGTRSGQPRASAIGIRMSGGLAWAIVDPSVNSTIEWMTDCGWTTTLILSKPTPNSRWASITSSPLFTSVAELIVITGPMFQVGWASACSGVMPSSSARSRPRNGPPLAVSTSRATSPPVPQRRHCAIAECSESTGTIWPGAASPATSGPPVIRDSLFARASTRPARSAARVAASPLNPVTALSTTSADHAATSAMASGPARTVGGGARPSPACPCPPAAGPSPPPACPGPLCGPGRPGRASRCPVSAVGHCPVRGLPARTACAFSASRTSPAADSCATATTPTPNSMAWAASRSGLLPPAASPVIQNRPGLRRITSAAWVPTEPVEPSSTTSRGRERVSTSPFCPHPRPPAAGGRPTCGPRRPGQPETAGSAGGDGGGRRRLSAGGDGGWGGLPVGAQRHVGASVGVQPDPEDLVQFHDVVIEADARARHVQPPHPGGARPDLGDGLVPVGIQVRAPGRERPCVVLAQVLLVPDLESCAVHDRYQVAGPFQFPVGEHVPVDETACKPRRPGIVRPSDSLF